ncbi:HNH endonuclease [Glutamicibacter sp. X7]
MPFFQVDDQLHANQKASALAEQAIGGDLVGVAALGLWTMAGSYCQAALTDGLISHVHLMKILLNKDAVDLLAARLVEVGLWHATGHSCEQCGPVKEGHYLFHDWFQFEYDTGDNVRLARAKRKELKDPQIRADVWARDAEDYPKCSRGKCRYCGVMVFKKTSKGETRPEMDHVDPTLAVGVRNIVLSCAGCNRTKGRRKPEAAGMTLRPAPVREAAPAPSSLTTAPSGQQDVAPEPSSASRAVERGAQDLAASFGLRLGAASDTTPAPSSLTTAPSGQQDVAPEPSSSAAPDQDNDEDARWADEDPDFPAALTKYSTIDGPPEPASMVEEPEAIHGRAHARARAGRAGQGRDGLGAGSGQGQPDVTSDPAKPRRPRSRRKRGNKRSDTRRTGQGNSQSPEPMQTQSHDAGEAPHALTGGRHGSPFYGVKGQRVDPQNSTCEIHQLHLPCRKCQDAAERRYTEEGR